MKIKTMSSKQLCVVTAAVVLIPTAIFLATSTPNEVPDNVKLNHHISQLQPSFAKIDNPECSPKMSHHNMNGRILEYTINSHY